MNRDDQIQQLGMHPGTASNRLKKELIFSMAKELGRTICFQCGKEIKTAIELSIEHKVPYLHAENAKELFFDLNNIAFSHLKCNVGAARPPRRKEHGNTGYNNGCRCEVCKEAKSQRNKRYSPKRRKHAPVV